MLASAIIETVREKSRLKQDIFKETLSLQTSLSQSPRHKSLAAKLAARGRALNGSSHTFIPSFYKYIVGSIMWQILFQAL